MNYLIPVFILSFAGLLLLLLRLFKLKKDGVAIGISLTSLAAAIITLFIFSRPEIGNTFFGGTIMPDGISFFLQLLVYIATGFTILMSTDYIKEGKWGMTEYCSILLFAAIGMVFFMTSSDILSFYVGLELMALSSYVLAGYARGQSKSFEAAMKYFILGAFSSGILLYGISFIYGVTGSLNFFEISKAFTGTTDKLFLVGLILIICGMLFKVAAIPFHLWTPDVYEGAPTPITAFFSVGPKIAAFAAFFRLFSLSFGESHSDWSLLIGLSCGITMVGANLMALAQDNVKRLIAYSSIASAGYVLLGVLAQNPYGKTGLVYYLFAYLFANIGVFSIIIFLNISEYGAEKISDFKGLHKKHPWISFAMLIFLLSLVGIPGTAGFIGKFYLFAGSIQAGMITLSILGVLMSVVSLYYFFKIVVNMYMAEESATHGKGSLGISIVIYTCLIGTLVFGILPTRILNALIQIL